MAVRKRQKKLAAGLLLLLVGGFIYTTTGARAARQSPAVTAPDTTSGALADAQVAAQAVTRSLDFDGDVRSPIRVTCAPGATKGTGEVEMKVIGGKGFETGDTIPSVLVTWNGGSTHINKYNTFFEVSHASLPCPGGPRTASALAPPTLNFPFTFHFEDNNHIEIAKLILNAIISINLGN